MHITSYIIIHTAVGTSHNQHHIIIMTIPREYADITKITD